MEDRKIEENIVGGFRSMSVSGMVKSGWFLPGYKGRWNENIGMMPSRSLRKHYRRIEEKGVSDTGGREYAETVLL